MTNIIQFISWVFEALLVLFNNDPNSKARWQTLVLAEIAGLGVNLSLEIGSISRW